MGSVGRPQKFDWEEIRKKWETGKYTMQDLADEYGFSARSGYKKSSAENWKKGSTEHKLDNALEERILDNETKIRKQTRIEYYMIFKQLRELIADEALEKGEPDKRRIQTLKTAIDAIKSCKEAEWDILLLDQNLENWSAKYRIEKKEVKEVLLKEGEIVNSLKKLWRESKGSDREQLIDDDIEDSELEEVEVVD